MEFQEKVTTSADRKANYKSVWKLILAYLKKKNMLFHPTHHVLKESLSLGIVIGMG